MISFCPALRAFLLWGLQSGPLFAHGPQSPGGSFSLECLFFGRVRAPDPLSAECSASTHSLLDVLCLGRQVVFPGLLDRVCAHLFPRQLPGIPASQPSPARGEFYHSAQCGHFWISATDSAARDVIANHARRCLDLETGIPHRLYNGLKFRRKTLLNRYSPENPRHRSVKLCDRKPLVSSRLRPWSLPF